MDRAAALEVCNRYKASNSSHTEPLQQNLLLDLLGQYNPGADYLGLQISNRSSTSLYRMGSRCWSYQQRYLCGHFGKTIYNHSMECIIGREQNDCQPVKIKGDGRRIAKGCPRCDIIPITKPTKTRVRSPKRGDAQGGSATIGTATIATRTGAKTEERNPQTSKNGKGKKSDLDYELFGSEPRDSDDGTDKIS